MGVRANSSRSIYKGIKATAAGAAATAD